jgi:hypothetical protein
LVKPLTDVEAGSSHANREAFDRICASEPMLVDVRPAGEVVPGLTRETILTSGAPLPWAEYSGGQRRAIVGGALFEGLASDPDAVAARLAGGDLHLRPCHDHGCVGSVAGVYTASMPVFVVENRAGGNRAFCNLFEGVSPKRLNYGVYDDEVRRNLLVLQDDLAPLLGDAVRALGGVPLRPIVRRALHMGDELHSRNTAATLLFTRELFPALLDLGRRDEAAVRRLLDFVRASDYFFLRLSMAASKATADAAHGILGSSVVTAMSLSCREFAIRVSGLGARWFRAPLPDVSAMKLFPGFGPHDVEFMGGESCIAETVGLGGFAQAAAFPLQEYQGGTSEHMVEMNRAMYRITVGEHPEFKIPYLGFRGTPVGIDVHRVVATGITPVIDAGVAGKAGGQIGAGVLTAPLACFAAAAEALRRRDGDGGMGASR